MGIYAKISPKMVNPRHIAGNAEEEDQTTEAADIPRNDITKG